MASRLNFRSLYTQAETQSFRLRVFVLGLVVLLLFALLAYRLSVLQVQRYAAFSERAESNRTAVVPIVPNRACGRWRRWQPMPPTTGRVPQ